MKVELYMFSKYLESYLGICLLGLREYVRIRVNKDRNGIFYIGEVRDRILKVGANRNEELLYSRIFYPLELYVRDMMLNVVEVERMSLSAISKRKDLLIIGKNVKFSGRKENLVSDLYYLDDRSGYVWDNFCVIGDSKRCGNIEISNIDRVDNDYINLSYRFCITINPNKLRIIRWNGKR